MFVVNKNCCQEEKVLMAINFFNQKSKQFCSKCHQKFLAIDLRESCKRDDSFPYMSLLQMDTTTLDSGAGNKHRA